MFKPKPEPRKMGVAYYLVRLGAVSLPALLACVLLFTAAALVLRPSSYKPWEGTPGHSEEGRVKGGWVVIGEPAAPTERAPMGGNSNLRTQRRPCLPRHCHPHMPPLGNTPRRLMTARRHPLIRRTRATPPTPVIRRTPPNPPTRLTRRNRRHRPNRTTQHTPRTPPSPRPLRSEVGPRCLGCNDHRDDRTAGFRSGKRSTGSARKEGADRGQHWLGKVRKRLTLPGFQPAMREGTAAVG